MTAATTDRQTDRQADGGLLLRFHSVSSVPGSVSREDTHQGEHPTRQTRGPWAGKVPGGQSRSRGSSTGRRGRAGPGEGARASDSTQTGGKSPGS